MILNQIDRNNYFKGLLVLVGIRRKITKTEEVSVKNVAKILDLNQNFVDDVIKKFHENKYIIETPPKFSNHILAEIFLRDGMRVAFTDKMLHLHELEWLARFAVNNNFSKQWFFIELENYLESYMLSPSNSFEIQNYIN